MRLPRQSFRCAAPAWHAARLRQELFQTASGEEAKLQLPPSAAERLPSAEHLAEIYPGGHQLCLKAHTSQAAMRFSLSVAVGQYYYLSFPNGKTETRRD